MGIKCRLLLLFFIMLLHTEGPHDWQMELSQESFAVFWKNLQWVDISTICTVGTIKQFHTFHGSCFDRAPTMSFVELLICQSFAVQMNIFSTITSFCLSFHQTSQVTFPDRIRNKQLVAEPPARWRDYCLTPSFRRHFHLPLPSFQCPEPASPPLMSFCLCAWFCLTLFRSLSCLCEVLPSYWIYKSVNVTLPCIYWSCPLAHPVGSCVSVYSHAQMPRFSS